MWTLSNSVHFLLAAQLIKLSEMLTFLNCIFLFFQLCPFSLWKWLAFSFSWMVSSRRLWLKLCRWFIKAVMQTFEKMIFYLTCFGVGGPPGDYFSIFVYDQCMAPIHDTGTNTRKSTRIILHDYCNRHDTIPEIQNLICQQTQNEALKGFSKIFAWILRFQVWGSDAASPCQKGRFCFLQDNRNDNEIPLTPNY